MSHNLTAGNGPIAPGYAVRGADEDKRTRKQAATSESEISDRENPAKPASKREWSPHLPCNDASKMTKRRKTETAVEAEPQSLLQQPTRQIKPKAKLLSPNEKNEEALSNRVALCIGRLYCIAKSENHPDRLFDLAAKLVLQITKNNPRQWKGMIRGRVYNVKKKNPAVILAVHAFYTNTEIDKAHKFKEALEEGKDSFGAWPLPEWTVQDESKWATAEAEEESEDDMEHNSSNRALEPTTAVVSSRLGLQSPLSLDESQGPRIRPKSTPEIRATAAIEVTSSPDAPYALADPVPARTSAECLVKQHITTAELKVRKTVDSRSTPRISKSNSSPNGHASVTSLDNGSYSATHSISAVAAAKEDMQDVKEAAPPQRDTYNLPPMTNEDYSNAYTPESYYTSRIQEHDNPNQRAPWPAFHNAIPQYLPQYFPGPQYSSRPHPWYQTMSPWPPALDHRNFYGQAPLGFNTGPWPVTPSPYDGCQIGDNDARGTIPSQSFTVTPPRVEDAVMEASGHDSIRRGSASR